MNIPQFRADVNERLSVLRQKYQDGFVFLLSLHNSEHNSTAGVVSQVSVDNAAPLLVKRTHRELTPDEVVAFLESEGRQAEARRQADINAARRQFLHMIGANQVQGPEFYSAPEVAKLVADAVKAQVKPGEPAKPEPEKPIQALDSKSALDRSADIAQSIAKEAQPAKPDVKYDIKKN